MLDKAVNNLAFLRDGGKTGELIRAKDWTVTPLGHPFMWPSALRHSVSMMLNSQSPNLISWGKDYTLLYNDAYAPINGQRRHLYALGESARNVYSELWDSIESMFERAMAGQAILFSDFMVTMDRKGYMEDCYFDLSYTPIRDEEGVVQGIFIHSTETTEKVLAKKMTEQASLEMTTINEELTATNEELDQAYSEMAAINEELAATNEELHETQTNVEQALRQLEESDARFRNLIRDATVGIILLIGSEMKVEVVNDAYGRLIGRTVDELQGRNLFEIIPEAEPDFRPIIDPVRETGQPLYLYDIPYQVNHENKVISGFLNLVYHPYREKNGNITGVMILCQDVTQQVIAKQTVEDNERHFRHLADLIPAKVSNALPTGEVTFFNKAWLEYSGLSFEDLRDFGYLNMMHPDEIETFQRGLGESAAKGIPYESEMRFKDINGHYRWHLNIASPVLDADGQIIMWVGCTTEIQRMKEEEQRKNDFIGMVSHELKTPLTSINAYLQLLQVKASNAGDGFQNNAINQAVKQTRKMTAMINGFLNVSRLDSSEILITRQNFDIVELLKETEQEMTLLNTSHKFHFESHEPLFISADRDKIGHVLNNIISNACKYSATGSTISVKCKADAQNVVLSISDEGVGINTEDFNRLFERYYRVENNNIVSGFGIGLYLCAEIIKRHDGKIWVESVLGDGSTFHCSLPISR